ncbi:MAG: PilT/PilU family type 4a pilus ATPase [Planctomycetes bacterium]|nr:PilT/PilU family type 4a pilus ATPase [Planctomycetota bacterium]MCW8138538.1 PilT/PilU family type 4a pilus ATPase [Planctomycetota bacterium]
MEFNALLSKMVKARASDLFVKVGSPPSMRIDGRVRFLQDEPTSTEDAKKILFTITKPRGGAANLVDPSGHVTKEIDLAYDLPKVGRFRVNVSAQRGQLFFVFRTVTRAVMTFEDLLLPREPLEKLASLSRGMVLVTGVTGSGKSSTLAAMVNFINQSMNKHVVTIEDPIEYVFKDKRSIITQREVGHDTQSFPMAIRAAMRQAPDVLMIGEMRDQETMEASIHAAETGHLVFSTLHTVNAQQTVERIINYFPPHQHELIRMQLSMVLEGVVAQRLGPRKGGVGRVPAIELMISSPTIRDMLREGRTTDLYKCMAESEYFGCQTFNQSICKLYRDDLIALEDAMKLADNPEELKMELRGIVKGARATDFDFNF